MYKSYNLKNSYIFHELIGSGGMGEIWLAERLSIGDYVAVKILKNNISERNRKLKSEAQLTSSLNHPNICKVFEFLEYEGNSFLVMEYLKGLDLAQALKLIKYNCTFDRLSLALYISKEILKALELAHGLMGENKSPILHMDIKPSNIFLTQNGEVKLLDLGISSTVSDKVKAKKSNSFFSLHYTSPEFWRNGVYDSSLYTQKDDIYALGLIFFEILSGDKAFSGTDESVYKKIELGQIPPIESFCNSKNVCNIFSIWTNRESDARYKESEKLLKLISTIVLENKISDDIVKNVIQLQKDKNISYEVDQTVKIRESSKMYHMKLVQTGHLEESFGRLAEEEILAIIQETFGSELTRIFVNNTIPYKNKAPDFVIPAIDSEGKFKFIIIECKATREINPNGSTKYSDPFKQVKTYENIIKSVLKRLNRECDFLCLVALPNMLAIPPHLSKNGRDGVLWVTKVQLKNKLKEYRAISQKDKEYEIVQMVYAHNEVLQKYREKIVFNGEQEKIINWGVGGTKRIYGLAGTGKSLLLAKKLVNDALFLKSGTFLYLTHNTNLQLTFQNYFENFLRDENVQIDSIFKERSSTHYLCKRDDCRFKVVFCTFDAFPTSCVTELMDKYLFGATSNGPLYKKVVELRKEFSHNLFYRKVREELFQILKEKKIGREESFQMYDNLYIDEFQDCRVDPYRLKLPLLFVKTTENGEPNLCFSEDALQCFVKYSALKEIDHTFDDVKKSELANNQQLGLPKLVGRSKKLDTIYRTPEKIFKISLNILENLGGLLKNKRDEISKLKFKNKIGNYYFINEEDIGLMLDYMLNERQSSFQDIIIIQSLENRKKSSLYSRLISIYSCNEVENKNSPREDAINIYHEYNVRGLESKAVFLILDEYLIEKPNYIYTLICRTKSDIVFVKSFELSKDKFENFVKNMSDKPINIAS